MVIAAQLEKAGIRAKLDVVDYGVFGPKRLARQTVPLYIYRLGDWAFDMGVHLKSYYESHLQVNQIWGAKECRLDATA